VAPSREQVAPKAAEAEALPVQVAPIKPSSKHNSQTNKPNTSSPEKAAEADSLARR
jgi:hypothetical protein